MSTRYVWDRFNKAEGYAPRPGGYVTSIIFTTGTQGSDNFVSSDYKLTAGNKFIPSGDIIQFSVHYVHQEPTNPYKYFFSDRNISGSGDPNYSVYFDEKKVDGNCWAIIEEPSTGESTQKVLIIKKADGSREVFRELKYDLGPIPGSFLGNISSKNSTTYPEYGIYGNYWYTYKGSDTIDPSAVTYSKQDLTSGETTTVFVSSRTPTYGGTIYYQYQYSTDGGNTWTNIGSKTTEARKTVTIPEGAEQFQARVQASDGWGFTSTTYVYGPSLPVSQIKSYATVGGKLAAGAKMYATMGGKIRQIQKGYATVGGKIRKLF